jgi:hypothetical protein
MLWIQAYLCLHNLGVTENIILFGVNYYKIDVNIMFPVSTQCDRTTP